MRRIAAFLLCLLCCAPAGWALAQGARGPRGTVPAPGADQGPLREISVTNRAQQPVRELYASPSTTDEWGDDRLAAEPLPPGKTFRLRLGRTRECSWDMQVVYADGATEESHNINVCRTHLVSFDGSAAVAPDVPAAGPVHTLAVRNASLERIDQVFVSPGDADQWFESRLHEPIAPGDSGVVEFQGPCQADVRVVYATRAAEERRGMDICQLERLVVAPGWVLRADPSALPTPAAASAPNAQADGAASANGITVRNDGARALVELFVYPDGGERGDDRLGMSVLDPGQQRRIPVASDKGCMQTVHAVLAGAGPDLERTGIDVCKERRLQVTADAIQPAGSGEAAAAPAR